VSARARKAGAVAPSDLPANLAGWRVLLDYGGLYDLLRKEWSWREASDSVALTAAVQDRGSGWTVMFDHRHPPPGAPASAASDQVVIEGDHPTLGWQTLVVPVRLIRLASPPPRRRRSEGRAVL